MTNFSRDPKGYYVALGIEETADADAIKAAFRNKAKRLHPDFNPSPIAAKQFHRVHEAYETLSDPVKREEYDKPWRGAHTNEHRKAETERPPPKRPKAARTNGATKPKDEPRPEPKPARAGTDDQPAICKCGRITAQPRYIIFDLVWGRMTRVQRSSISGVFCRSCADRTAVRASLITWLAGWWGWPNGPRDTIKALISNIRGGRKPNERNARLLIRQSRAFRARGEMELSRNAAEQALNFAATPALRREVDSLLMSLSAYPARTLKNRWAKPGWAMLTQLLPLALIVTAISMTAALSAPTSLTDMARSLFAIEREAPTQPTQPGAQSVNENTIGRVFSVAAETASLRTGPGESYQLVAVLAKDTVVLATEFDPSGAWLRIVTADGTEGFIALESLSTTVRAGSRDAISGLGSAPPQSGEGTGAAQEK
ncbi:MAG: DnaJ domain-containing protein [Rhodospirillaceae bacterium]